MWPHANIAIATGEKSGFFVIDIDDDHGGSESIKALMNQHGVFEDKVFQKTGSGWHLFFKHPGIRIGNIQSSLRLGAGIDVRGDGGYIVAPPSLHEKGTHYEWGTPYDPIPDAPRWLIEALRRPEQKTDYTGIGDIPAGQRNNTLTSIAGSMRRKGLTEGAILAALKVENLARCSPPLDDIDVERIAKSIARYTPEAPIQARDPQYGEGIYSVRDLDDLIDELYESGLEPGVSTGWIVLDEFYTVKKKQWTVVSGIPSHGKSAVLDALMVNLAREHGWKFCVCSPENQPIERHVASLMSLYVGQPFNDGPTPRMSRENKTLAKAWVDEHFVFVLPLESQCTVEGVLDLVSEVRNQRTVDGFILDPWNELEHKRPDKMSETEYVSESLSCLRRYTRAHNVHFWLVVHPTKLQKDQKNQIYPVPTLYDCHGSAHFRNKADNGIVVWRDLMNDSLPTEIHVQKIRFRECGRTGKAELYFDKASGRFNEFPRAKTVGIREWGT